jgi:hypothetical protein
VRRTRLAPLVLVLVAAAYPVAALQTPPGFYEGFCPPVDYKFLKPPPGVKAGTPPGGAHTFIKITHDSSGRSIVSPGFVATLDDNPQAQLSFIPDAFQLPAGGAEEVIDIKPVTDYPAASGITVVTNVYLVTSSTPMTKTSNLRLLYSTLLPAPSSIYVAQPGGSWQALPSSASTSTGCSDISSQVSSTGYFLAGYPTGSGSSSGGTRVGGGQLLPIVVALAILIVVLAGVPLAVVRRRQAAAEEGPPEPRSGKRRRPRRRT